MHLTQFTLEIDVDDEVQVSLIPRIWLHRERTVHLLALLHSHVVFEVKDGLLPMCVGRLWCRTETDALVALGELDVEKCHQGLDVVVAADLKRKRGREVQIGFLDL